MIPKNPFTLIINGGLVDSTLKAIAGSYLPNYEIQVTSGYRNEQKNKAVGGAADSAHMYNLARDFVLINKATGQIASDAEMKKIYTSYIKPYWEGYSMFTPKQPHTNTGWIHVNLDRSISENVKWIAYAATAAAVGVGIKEIWKHIKLNKKGR